MSRKFHNFNTFSLNSRPLPPTLGGVFSWDTPPPSRFHLRNSEVVNSASGHLRCSFLSAVPRRHDFRPCWVQVWSIQFWISVMRERFVYYPISTMKMDFAIRKKNYIFAAQLQNGADAVSGNDGKGTPGGGRQLLDPAVGSSRQKHATTHNRLDALQKWRTGGVGRKGWSQEIRPQPPPPLRG